MWKYSPPVSCNINDETAINDIVKACIVKLTSITGNFETVLVNIPLLPAHILYGVTTPFSGINTTDINDFENTNLIFYTISPSVLLSYEDTSPPKYLENVNFNDYTYVSGDLRLCCQLFPPYAIDKHMLPFGIKNPKNHCYLNSVIQTLMPILRTIGYTCQFISKTEGSLTERPSIREACSNLQINETLST